MVPQIILQNLVDNEWITNNFLVNLEREQYSPWQLLHGQMSKWQMPPGLDIFNKAYVQNCRLIVPSLLADLVLLLSQGKTKPTPGPRPKTWVWPNHNPKRVWIGVKSAAKNSTLSPYCDSPFVSCKPCGGDSLNTCL